MQQLVYDFAGSTTVITGAGGGIGRAVATAFGKAGANVVVVDIQQPLGEETAALIREQGGEALFVRCDVSDPAAVDALVATTVDKFGSIEFACNNAALDLESGPLAEVNPETARRLVEVNFLGVANCMRSEIRQMLGQQRPGAIVNVASMNALRSRPDTTIYDGTKAAVAAMTRSAALAYTGKGIRVNAIAPGVTDTPMLATRMKNAGLDPEMLAPVANLLGRIGTPEEVAQGVLWLCSDASALVTGHLLPMEGGYLLKGPIG